MRPKGRLCVSRAMTERRALGIATDRGLVEDSRAIRVHADSKERSETLPPVSPQPLGFLTSCHGVEVDDGIYVPRLRLLLLLQSHPLAQRTNVVAQMRNTGRLDPREDNLWSKGFAGNGGRTHLGNAPRSWLERMVCEAVQERNPMYLLSTDAPKSFPPR